MNPVFSFFLIDDDLDNQEIFAIVLKQIDETAACFFANDGIYALEKIKADNSFVPQVISIDINMPRMNGIQCLAEIKKIDHLKTVPVIFYSTFADPEKIVEMKALGAAEYFEKPSDIDILINKLSSIFKDHHFLS